MSDETFSGVLEVLRTSSTFDSETRSNALVRALGQNSSEEEAGAVSAVSFILDKREEYHLTDEDLAADFMELGLEPAVVDTLSKRFAGTAEVARRVFEDALTFSTTQTVVANLVTFGSVIDLRIVYRQSRQSAMTDVGKEHKGKDDEKPIALEPIVILGIVAQRLETRLPFTVQMTEREFRDFAKEMGLTAAELDEARSLARRALG